MDLEVRHLRLVLAIAEEGSVTGAGARLHLTQSALSHQLRDIEDRLGTLLFRRVGRRLVVTPAGERLMATARSVLDDLGRAETDIRGAGARTDGFLRLCTECYTCYHWLPSLITRFEERFPRVEVRIVPDATPRPYEALLEGSIDLALVSSQPTHRSLTATPLFQDELVVIARPDHPLARRPFVKPEDLAAETLYIYSTPEENDVIRKLLLPAGLAPKRIVTAPLTEAILEFVKAGLGVSVIACWAVAPDVRSGALVALPLTRSGFFRQWSAARLKDRAEPAYLREFVRLLASGGMRALEERALGAEESARTAV